MIPQYIIKRLPNSNQALSLSGDLRESRASLPHASKDMHTDRPIVIWDCGGTNQLRAKLASGPAAAEVERKIHLCLSYFQRMFSRFGLTGRGDTVHVNINYGINFPNAFWDGTELVIGNGDGQVFGNFAQSIDVLAHEMSHGIVHHTSALRYWGQAGALNEHFADVFGTACQINILNQDEDRYDWLIGDEIMIDKGEALRSMRSPGTAYNNMILGIDSQPDHMSQFFKGDEDNGGVHINSGIMNRLFYLVARELGSHNAVRLWYAALVNLSHNAKFTDAVIALVDVAKRTGAKGAPQVIRWAAKEVGL